MWLFRLQKVRERQGGVFLHLWVLAVCTGQSSFKTHNQKVVGLEEGRGQSWVQNGYFGNIGPLGPCAGPGHQQPYPILLPGTLPAGFLNPRVPPAPYALGTFCSKSPEGSQRPRGTLGGPKGEYCSFLSSWILSRAF